MHKVKDYIKKMEKVINDNLPITVREKANEQLKQNILEIRKINEKKAIESGRLEIYRRLKVPEHKIEIELHEFGTGSTLLAPFPFFLTKKRDRETLRILFHEYPNAYKWEDQTTYVVSDSLIDEWVDDGYVWAHVEDTDVLNNDHSVLNRVYI